MHLTDAHGSIIGLRGRLGVDVEEEEEVRMTPSFGLEPSGERFYHLVRWGRME